MNAMIEQRASWTPTDIPARVTLTDGGRSRTFRITGTKRDANGCWWFTTPIHHSLPGKGRRIAPVPVRLFGRVVSLTGRWHSSAAKSVYRFAW